MSDSARDAISAWLNSALPFGDTGFAQIDVDELLQPSSKSVLACACRLFGLLLDEIAGRDEVATAMLVIPLPPSVRLLTSPPSIAALMARRWRQLEVPGLYVSKLNLLERWSEGEDFRRPVNWNLEIGRPTQCIYRAFRSPAERERGWEYTRALYVTEAPRG